jgi:hypothetical protein
MDWIFDNIRLIVIVGGAIAYWLNQRRKAKEEEEAARTMAPAQPKTQVGEDAERTRRIQEEIRRKILERAGGTKSPTATPPPIPEASPLSTRERPKGAAYVEPSVEQQEQTVAADQAMLERQQQLAAKLRELQQQRREHDRPAEVFAEKTALAMSASGTSVLGSPLADLRNPTAVRRAIILREVLGTPVGLR